MASPANESSATTAVPIGFGPPHRRCFGWYHAGASVWPRPGVVMCRPVGYEGVCSYETFTRLAEKLAAAGFPVLRFDYHGTGDSPGDGAGPAQVGSWLADIAAAMAELARLSGCRALALFGVRTGATLAASALASQPGVDSVVWWAPCPTGRAFVRELRATGAPHGGAAAPGLEAMGTVYTAQTLAELQALDMRSFAAPPAPRALIIDRDDLPAAGPLPGAYRDAGVDTTVASWPGYAAMMTDPHEAGVPDATLDAIVSWLGQAPALGEREATRATPPAQALPEPAVGRIGSVVERPMSFGDSPRLFGVLAEPAEPGPPAQTAVLMLNVGTTHRVGPGRLYVTLSRALAAQGLRALRFDMAGIGDSRLDAASPQSRLYSKQSINDVAEALAALATQGVKRFVLVGLCSGAYAAYQTARADARVAGLVLLNPRRLDWPEGETLEQALWRSYKPVGYYLRALAHPATYQRLLRRQVDLRRVLDRLVTIAREHLARWTSRLLRRSPPDTDVLGGVRALIGRGTDLLLVVAEGDYGLEYLEHHFGVDGGKLRGEPGFQMRKVAGADHTLSSSHSQAFVVGLLCQWLAGRPGAG